MLNYHVEVCLGDSESAMCSFCRPADDLTGTSCYVADEIFVLLRELFSGICAHAHKEPVNFRIVE